MKTNTSDFPMYYVSNYLLLLANLLNKNKIETIGCEGFLPICYSKLLNKSGNLSCIKCKLGDVSVELKTNFLYPTKPGKIIGYGNVVKSGKNIVFLEGSLEQNNKTVVTASSTCVIADMPQINFKKMIGDTNEK